MSRKEEDFEQLEATNADYIIALEKRLNEIRRLEGVNTALLEALELAQTESNCAAEMFDEHIRKGRAHEIMNALLAINQATTAAIKVANASKPGESS